MSRIFAITSRSLRISLVLTILALAFASYAFASNVQVVDTVAVDQSGMPIIGYLGNMQASEMYPMTYADHGGGKVTTTYDVSYTNLLPYDYQFRIAMYMIFDPAIKIDSYSVTPLNGAPAFDSVPVGGGGGGIQRVSTDKNGSYSIQPNKNQIHYIPANSTIHYLVKIDSSDTDAATAASRQCTRLVNQSSTGEVNYHYSRGPLQLDTWIDTFAYRNAEGQPIPDQMGTSFDAVGHGCADKTNVVAAPQQTTPVTQATSPATQATTPVTQATSPATQATTPATQATTPATQATIPAVEPASANAAPSATAPATVPATVPQVASRDLSTRASGQTPAKDISSPGLQENVNNSDHYNSIIALPAKTSHGSSIANASYDRESIIALPKPSSHSSSSQKAEYAIAALLIACAVSALVVGKKFPRREYVPVKQEPVTLSPSYYAEIVDTYEGERSARLYNSDITFVDVYNHEETYREPELVGAMSAPLPSTSSISRGASSSQPRLTKVYDDTYNQRQSLPARIWNELVKRTTREHHTVK